MLRDSQVFRILQHTLTTLKRKLIGASKFSFCAGLSLIYVFRSKLHRVTVLVAKPIPQPRSAGQVGTYTYAEYA